MKMKEVKQEEQKNKTKIDVGQWEPNENSNVEWLEEANSDGQEPAVMWLIHTKRQAPFVNHDSSRCASQ